MSFRIPEWKVKRAVRLRKEGKSWRSIARLAEVSTRTLLYIFRRFDLISKAQKVESEPHEKEPPSNGESPIFP